MHDVVLCRVEMMQGASVNSLTASASGRSCGTVALWQRDSRARSGISGNLWIGGLSLGKKRLPQSFSLRSHGSRRATLEVRATWLFNQSRGDMDANSERSESANEDILIFFFQLDLQTRIQVGYFLSSLISQSNDLFFFMKDLCSDVFHVGVAEILGG